jgi:predicted protein tyrosine phosphatase
MSQLRITTAAEALQLMQEGWPTRIVSLVGDDLRFELPSFGAHHFIGRFHDVEAETPGYVTPTADLLREALDHVSDLSGGDRLLIHCHAGKSRSPAFALGVLVQSGLSPRAALHKVRALRPLIIPNRLMISLLDDLLEQQAELIRVVRDHYADLPDVASLPNRGGMNL